MNGRIESLYYALVCGAALGLVTLWVMKRLVPGRFGRSVRTGLGGAAVLVPFLTVDGMPVWSWAFSICPNPSAPLAGLIGVAIWQQVTGVALFQPADWRASWIFGAVTGTALYLHPWLGGIDLYYWGWHGIAASTGLAVGAILLLVRGNRLGVLLLGALIAGKLAALESQNAWDYAVDPIYWAISLTGLALPVLRRWRRKGRADSGADAQTDRSAQVGN